VTDEALASTIRDRMRTALPATAHAADRALTAASRASVERFHSLLHDYPRRIGKMVRGRLVIHSTQAHGGSTDEPALTVAAALELFQAWVLIHDDIEDGSETRRGSPALHRLAGMPVALNVGDALHVYMWRLLHELLDAPGVDAKAVLDEFGSMISRTAEGQHLDLSFVHEGRFDIGEDAYLEMVTLKTAHYTVASPLKLGALLSGVEPDPALVGAGIDLGVAFQIRDDVLNLRRDTDHSSEYGKEFAGDLYEGKRTLIIAHLMATASKADADEVTRLLSGPRSQRSPTAVTRLLDLIERYGSLRHAQNVADARAASGLERIRSLAATLPGRAAAGRLLAVLEPVAQRLS